MQQQYMHNIFVVQQKNGDFRRLKVAKYVIEAESW
jgi:hypothetical protein